MAGLLVGPTKQDSGTADTLMGRGNGDNLIDVCFAVYPGKEYKSWVDIKEHYLTLSLSGGSTSEPPKRQSLIGL